MTELFDNNSGAEFSSCGKYRYKLWRIWDDSLPKAMCIGLNPSTANANKNDQTISYLIKMLAKLGYGGFYMMNLFAWISSKPDDLLTCVDPVGENNNKLKEVELICDDVIVCWGNFKQAEQRIKEVLPNYPHAKCFGETKNGKPFHPLAMMPRNGRDPNNPELFLYSIKKQKMTLVIAPSIDQYHYYLQENKVSRDDQKYKYVTSMESIRGRTSDGCCVVIVNRFLLDGNREDAVELASKRGLSITNFNF